MLRELAHFFRNAPEVLKAQNERSKAEFADWLNDRIDAQGFAAIRRELAAGLAGRVLEIGCGTGAMFAYYDANVRVEAIEPDADFRELAHAKAVGRPNIHVADGDAMHLDFDDASFDAVIVSLVLCSVPSVEQVLREIHRVLRPGGRMRALEHVRSTTRAGGLLMHVANPLWLLANKQGCNMNRQPVPLIEAAGFAIENVRDFQTFDTLMPAFPMQRIDACRVP
jgi:ubiquinone/menaquinone biosynthesis C-methylase UbiE